MLFWKIQNIFELSLKTSFLDFLDMCGHRDPPKLGPKKIISPRKREFTKQDRPKIASPLKNFGKISFVKWSLPITYNRLINGYIKSGLNSIEVLMVHRR